MFAATRKYARDVVGGEDEVGGGLVGVEAIVREAHGIVFGIGEPGRWCRVIDGGDRKFLGKGKKKDKGFLSAPTLLLRAASQSGAASAGLA